MCVGWPVLDPAPCLGSQAGEPCFETPNFRLTPWYNQQNMVRVDGGSIVDEGTCLDNHPKSTKIMREAIEDIFEKNSPKGANKSLALQQQQHVLPERLSIPEDVVPQVRMMAVVLQPRVWEREPGTNQSIVFNSPQREREGESAAVERP